MVAHRHFHIASYIVVFTALIDQLTKQWVVGELGHPGALRVITPWLNIGYAENRGVTFGLLNSIGHQYMPYILIGVALLIVFTLGRWLWKTSSLLVSIALAFVLGGAIGNIIDRFRYGAVVDFLDFHYNAHHWYAFNVADAAICTGVFLLILDSAIRSR